MTNEKGKINIRKTNQRDSENSHVTAVSLRTKRSNLLFIFEMINKRNCREIRTTSVKR